jgi:hypothetical protein
MFKALSLSLLLLSGCADDATTQSSYVDVTANAGVDIAALRGDLIQLDGSASTVSESYALIYTWQFALVPIQSGLDDSSFGASNGSADGVSINVIPDVVGTYVIALQVTDGETTSSEDLVTVTVSTDNQAPNANAGDDLQGEVGQLTTLNGEASVDPDGFIAEYRWAFASTPADSSLSDSNIYNANSANPSFVPDAAGPYTVALTVSDGLDWSAADYVGVSVATDALMPVADAGEHADHPPCDTGDIPLDGRGSYDPEGAALTYHWALIGAPLGSVTSSDNLSDTTSATPSFAWDAVGTYSFTLQVNDGDYDSAMDLVTVETHDILENERPTARAGDDLTVNQTVNCWSEGVDTVCDICDDLGFELDGSATTDPNNDQLDITWTAGDISIANPDSLWTTFDPGTVQLNAIGTVNTQANITLTVSDCSYSSTDSVLVNLTCKGEN